MLFQCVVAGSVTNSNARKITVAYFARARELSGISEEQFELIQPTSLQQLLSQILTNHPNLREIERILKALVNGRSVSETTELNDGDRVVLVPPVGGG
jgi:MoaD family protein